MHVPFCVRACPYCDFDFQVARQPPVDAYLDGLLAEVGSVCGRLGADAFAGLGTIYVGGGTPSALGPSGIARLGELLRALAPHDDAGWADEERTIELNPEHVDEAMLDAVVGAGFDRVSLGVQSFESEGLRCLGRAHDPRRGRDAIVASLGRAGVRVSVDLIVGWPGQTSAMLARDLDVLLDLGVGHVSIYALTIEPQVPWNKLVKRGLRVLPDDDLGARMLEQVERTLRDAGLVHYEVASYGRPGEIARHNAKYWSWTDYVGLGPSAASARYSEDGSVERRTNVRGFEAWRATAGSTEPGEAGEVEHLGPEAAAREGLWIGLRRLDGLDIAAFERRFGRGRAWWDAVIAPRVAVGDLIEAGGTLRVAPDRWLWHDAIAAAILGE